MKVDFEDRQWCLKDEANLSTQQVLDRIALGRLTQLDWIYCSQQQTWERLGQSRDFSSFLSWKVWRNSWNFTGFEDPHRPLWILRLGSELVGPWSTLQLLEHARRTEAAMQIKIWQKGWAEWRQLWEVFPVPTWTWIPEAPRDDSGD